MVPIGPRFEQQRRTVRDLAETSQKPMRLEMKGREVEIDASLIEHIKDPLTHLVRNAADHAIEAPELRRAMGKDPVATITLRATGSLDRKSTRLNSSHLGISYAVFCLKKKKRI